MWVTWASMRGSAVFALVAVMSFAATSRAEDGDEKNWAAYGRTWQANHYSPLDQINDKSIDRLKLEWFKDVGDLGSVYTSPICVDGVLYYTAGLGRVFARNALNGDLLWSYDAEVGKVAGVKLRYAWGSRGIGYWNGNVYFGTLDGRLIALNARTGALFWSVQTTAGADDGRYITGAPWLFNGKVLIGHGGADFSSVRGYATAYDALTGKKVWRFFTVPGNPADGPDGEASDSVMAMAAKTWTGEWWKFGGGGTAWNAFAFDKKYNRIYIGTGNGDPWNQKIRSPQGGDNLFLVSIIAVDADTGKYVWHYQINPGESWDYNAAMDITLADVKIGGQLRSVLMHAPKNGFFYVIDRETGKVLSAEKFVAANWADRIDLVTGRPVERPGIRYENGQGAYLTPGPVGGHNAQPMSYSLQTGLAYIPAQEMGYQYSDEGIDLKAWKPVPGRGYNIGLTESMPPKSAAPPRAFLEAWNPVTQSKAWSVPVPLNPGGGVTSTAGNLVMQGDSDGRFNIYSADLGKRIWSFDAQAGISSQPITYQVNGKQYITVISGYRGIIGPSAWDYRTQKRRVLTFSLDGKASLPPVQPHAKAFVDVPSLQVDPAKARLGAKTFGDYKCVFCHGGDLAAGGTAPDLRESPLPGNLDAFSQILQQGLLRERGMPQYGELSPAQVEGLQHYIIATARAAKAGQAPPYPTPAARQ